MCMCCCQCVLTRPCSTTVSASQSLRPQSCQCVCVCVCVSYRGLVGSTASLYHHGNVSPSLLPLPPVTPSPPPQSAALPGQCGGGVQDALHSRLPSRLGGCCRGNHQRSAAERKAVSTSPFTDIHVQCA